jgi:hypothetical protein
MPDDTMPGTVVLDLTDDIPRKRDKPATAHDVGAQARCCRQAVGSTQEWGEHAVARLKVRAESCGITLVGGPFGTAPKAK